LLTGSVQITEFTMQVLQGLQSLAAGQLGVVDGQATFSGLDPGTYTALVVSIASGAESSGNPLSGAKWATKVIEVARDQEVSVSLNL
jgi:hypothetical protein